MQDLETHGVLSGIIPFYVPMRLLLTGQRVDAPPPEEPVPDAEAEAAAAVDASVDSVSEVV